MVLACSIHYLLVFFLMISYSIGQYAEVCTTPGGTQGTCISVRSCLPMMTVLLTVKRPLSDSAREQLEAYICTAEYKVCCPSGPILIREETSPPVSDNTEPSPSTGTLTDITKHKNFGLLPSECGYVDIASIRVINGENAGLNEYPWMSLLSFRGPDNKGKFNCGGSIINNRYILTAAHCLEDRSKLLGVRVGEYNIAHRGIDCLGNECNYPVQDVAIEDIISHPNYESKQKINDIGLLRVTPINFNDKNIKPVCLPRLKKTEFNPESTEVSGWGVKQQFGTRNSDVLQKAYLKVVSQSDCQNYYQNLTVIDDTRICAGGGSLKNNSNVCKGDSGGPLQVQERLPGIGIKYIQHGIVSFGVPRCDYPAVFTKVDYYMDWILDNMRP